MYEAERRSRAHYQRRARLYDWANRMAALLRGASQMRERGNAVDKLRLRPGDRVLEVSVGTGTNVPLLWERLGPEGRLVGIDLSRAMLERCREKLRKRSIAVDLIDGEAAHLPLPSGTFDAVFHHGGIAEFGDKQGAVNEIVRVARPGARIVICDVGVPTDRQLPILSKLLLRIQPEYQQPPPLDLMPPDAKDLQLSWFHGGAWYAIEFQKP